ncbi:MAG: dihydrofolate reductase [Candidatus Saccharimonadales bacterium]
MRIALAAVVSLDGRLTRGDDPNSHAWTSIEDWRIFVELRSKHDALIMGRETYELIKPEPEAGTHRVVVAVHPELYKGMQVKDQLEFMKPDPAVIIAELAKRGRKRVLIAGDSTITYRFLKAGLVDDLYVTFEPVLFGAGNTFMAGPQALDVKARLKSVKKLNEQGTLLAHYTITR